MRGVTVGFIGGGRVTRIILEGFKRAGKTPGQVVVSDTNAETLTKLKERFPETEIAPNNNQMAASQDTVFLAVHPPAVGEVLAEIKSRLRSDAVLVSLAPKLTIAKLSELLGGFKRIVRMIPNACSFVNAGYNPVTFSGALSEAEKQELTEIFGALGDCPVVAEEKLEAYAILTAIGPTYLWFQLYELTELASSFGLSSQEIEDGILKMVTGSVKTMYDAGIPPEDVMDLIPAKPLGEHEEAIREIYRTRLEGLYKKLKGG